MARIVEHSADDPNGPLHAGAWKILSPAEAEQLRRALQRRSAAAQGQPANEPRDPSQPISSPEERQAEPQPRDQVQTRLLFGMTPAGQQPSDPPATPDDRAERLRKLRQRRLQQAQPEQPGADSGSRP